MNTSKKATAKRQATGYAKNNGKEVAQEWDILKRDLEELDIDPRAKTIFLRMLQQNFGGRMVYVRSTDAVKERRSEAILKLLNQKVSPLDAGIQISARFRISRKHARRLVARALKGDL